MAQNPMQRKMTNAFLLGVLLMLLIAAAVVGLLLVNINKMKQEKEKLESFKKSTTKTVYVAKQAIPEGTIAYGASDANGNSQILIEQRTVSTLMTENLLDSSDLEIYNESTGETKVNTLKSKFDITEGTVLTKEMFLNDGIDSSERLMEYNMISLPSQLLENTYIDVRILLPSGEDFVVVSKKFVEQVSSSTIWMKMSESEIEILSNAIIESYIIDGAKLYATTYTSPASQKASKCTYVPAEKVRDILKAMISDDKEKIDELTKNWSVYGGVRGRLEQYLRSYDADEQKEKTAAGIENEKTELKTARDTFLESMGY